jgi:hypothetical protein
MVKVLIIWLFGYKRDIFLILSQTFIKNIQMFYKNFVKTFGENLKKYPVNNISYFYHQTIFYI